MIFLMAGAGLLVAAVGMGLSARGFNARAASAPGVVIRLNAGGSHPEIEFTAASGETISFPQGGLIFGYRPGQKVRVLYGPEDPRGTACIDAFGALWFAPLVLVTLGIGMIIAGIASSLALRVARSTCAIRKTTP